MATAVLAVFLLGGCSTDDTFDEGAHTATTQKDVAIGFGSYLGRSATTRGTAINEPAEIALNGGVGVFAMYTSDGKYDPASTNANDTTDFVDNFMQNFNVHSALSDDSLLTGTANVADNWTYGPLRFWPSKSDDYVSFMAYAPYNSGYGTLYNNQAATTGDRTYIRHTVNAEPRDQVDLLYSSGTNITNMQLYDQDGTWHQTGDFYQADENSVPRVRLNFKHATSRIGFVVTSSTLKQRTSFSYSIENEKRTLQEIWEEAMRTGMSIEISEDLESDFYIRVNKVMFLGDNSSAETDSPTGAFAPSALLNLSAVTADKPLWTQKATDGKLAFNFDNTLEDSIRTSNGIYQDGAFIDRFYDYDNNPVSGYYIWVPKDFTDDWESSSAKELVDQLKDLISQGYSGYYTTMMRWALNDYTSSDEEVQQKYYQMLYDQWKVSMYGDVLKGTYDHETEEITANSIGNRANDYMFTIPEDFTDGSGNDLWVYLDYDIVYTGGASGDPQTKGVNYKEYRKLDANFEAGKAYVVVMDIAADSKSKKMNSINFTVQTTPWPDEQAAALQY